MSTVAEQTRMKVRQIPSSQKLYYTVEEVKILLGVEQDKAYKIIRALRQELTSKGYAEYPAGKVPKRYFLERYFMDEKEADHVLQRMSGLRCSS